MQSSLGEYGSSAEVERVGCSRVSEEDIPGVVVIAMRDQGQNFMLERLKRDNVCSLSFFPLMDHERETNEPRCRYGVSIECRDKEGD